MRSNSIRFTGMASGMDTDSIVKDLMRPQQLKIDREKKSQALIVLRQEAWKEMNKKLYNFHINFANKMSLGGTFNQTITNSSNPNAMSIDNGTSVPKGTHNFEITQLATSASISGNVDPDKKFTNETKVWELMGLASEPVEGTEYTLKVNDQEIKVKANDTINGIANAINSNKELSAEGIRANYDAANGRFFINSTKTGKGSKITVGSDDLSAALGLAGGVAQGDEAIYKYNGTQFTSETNKIEINGIKATLKAAKAGEIITIASEPNTEGIYNFVKDFVEEYNKLMEEINEKLGTKPAKGIDPLTSEERESMSDNDIKLWEEKINKSLFYRDPQLESFMNSTRGMIGGIHERAYNPDSKKYDGEVLNKSYNSLAGFGIVTGSWEERGKLHIRGDGDDTNKLREAIENNPEDVMKFFTTLGKKLYDDQRETLKSSDLKSAMNFYNDKVMTDQVETHAKQILTLEERMYKMEQMHYAKFAAMEKMLNSLNSQSSWLSQQFGG